MTCNEMYSSLYNAFIHSVSQLSNQNRQIATFWDPPIQLNSNIAFWKMGIYWPSLDFHFSVTLGLSNTVEQSSPTECLPDGVALQLPSSLTSGSACLGWWELGFNYIWRIPHCLPVVSWQQLSGIWSQGSFSALRDARGCIWDPLPLE